MSSILNNEERKEEAEAIPDIDDNNLQKGIIEKEKEEDNRKNVEAQTRESLERDEGRDIMRRIMNEKHRRK